MSLPLGKLTILLGAGIVGSVLAKEGHLSNVSNLVSGALKIFSNPFKQVESHSSASKPHNDFLIAEVNHLRKELASLNVNSPITIVTGSGTVLPFNLLKSYNSLAHEYPLLLVLPCAGGRKYGIIIVVVAVGYGYIWWKGWKLPDLRFATKRSLSDACGVVAKQLEDVYSSISASFSYTDFIFVAAMLCAYICLSAQKQLSSKVTRVDHDVNKVAEISQATQEEVSILRGRSKLIGDEFQSVRDVVQTLEIKLSEIEGKQDYTTQGVLKLCDYAQRQGSGGITEHIQARTGLSLHLYYIACQIQDGLSHSICRISFHCFGVALHYSSSKKALESPTTTSSSRTGSLPLPLELPSPSNSNGSLKGEWPSHNSVSASGLKDFSEVSEEGESSSFRVPNGNRASEDSSNRSSSNGVLGLARRFSGAVLTRQRSATNAVAALSSGQQC
ncbi:hypothetical protein Pint_23756 [Pistacia integerrima]|uniref:Uncharacterized protein n=1 Tax=Pistacia integerrima TaxID=434235 RepID=A0ACC0YK26_9ROSI|nr:hypothetical protein Pint_23756 [Pistacia integerrima]